jgi:Restriction endonuclease
MRRWRYVSVAVQLGFFGRFDLVMAKRLSARYLELVYHATLKSYWRKKSLKAFLRRCGVAEPFLAELSDDKDVSKQDWLDHLFPKLENSEPGQTILQQIGRSLTEQASFPDLENWEDSRTKIANAKKAVAELTAFLNKIDEDKDAEKEAAQRRAAAADQRQVMVRSKATLQTLQERLDQLSMTALGTSAGGFDFEKWFYDFMDFCEIENRRPYRSDDNRQVDGSVSLDGTTYLVELKFEGKQADHDAIDPILNKINKKSDNTMGIVVAISGFTDGAKANASGPKSPLLLFDHSHLYMALNDRIHFKDVLLRVRRHSSQEGKAYLAVTDFSG